MKSSTIQQPELSYPIQKMVNSDSYLVYWIHTDGQSDPKSEGYIGVTKRSLFIRSNQHVSAAKDSPGNYITLHNAIRKHGTNLKIDLIGVGDEHFAYELENEYRPEECIGWNIRPGGQHLDSETQRSFWNRPGYKEGHIERMKALWSTDEFREKNLPNLQRGVEVFQAKVSKKPWITGKAAWTRNNVWPFAQQFYDVWVEDGMKGREALAGSVGIDSKSLAKIHRMFKDGWIPEEDGNWREDFRFGEYIGEFKDRDDRQYSLSECSRKNISESLKKTNANIPPWKFNRANKSVWSSADTLYEQYINNGYGYKSLAVSHGLPDQSCKTIHKKFKSGWNPNEDHGWIKDFREVGE